MKAKEIEQELSVVRGEQWQIFTMAEDKIARNRRLKYVKVNYFKMCVEAEMCPKCGMSTGVKIKHITTFHERMMEHEYSHTKITCPSCKKTTLVYIDH